MAESAALREFKAAVGEAEYLAMVERAEISRLASGKPRTMSPDAPAEVAKDAREVEAILNRNGR